MSCAEYSDILTEVALGARAEAPAQDHLAGCAACRGELERLRRLAVAMDDGLAELANAEPAPGFAARVRARLADRSAAPAFSWHGWVPAVAGGLAVLALVAWLAANRTQSPLMTNDSSEVVAPQEPPGPTVAPSPGVERTTEQIPARPPLRRKGHNGAPQMPEVLLADDQWAQVVRLYALAQQRRAQPEQLRPPDTAALEEKFQPLTIAQLEIKPLGEASPGLQ